MFHNMTWIWSRYITTERERKFSCRPDVNYKYQDGDENTFLKAQIKGNYFNVSPEVGELHNGAVLLPVLHVPGHSVWILHEVTAALVSSTTWK